MANTKEIPERMLPAICDASREHHLVQVETALSLEEENCMYTYIHTHIHIYLYIYIIYTYA